MSKGQSQQSGSIELAQRCAGLEEQHNSANAEVLRLGELKDVLDTDVARLSTELSTATARSEAVELELKDMQQKMDATAATVSEIQAAADEAQAQHAAVSLECENLKASNLKHTQECSLLADAKQSLEADVQRLQEHATRSGMLSTEVDELKKANKQCNEKVSELLKDASIAAAHADEAALNVDALSKRLEVPCQRLRQAPKAQPNLVITNLSILVTIAYYL